MAYNTIKIKKYTDIIEEYEAHAAITPGHLVELNSDNEVKVHATAGGNVLPMFALEDEMQGKDIDDAYVAGDMVQVWVATRGEIVYAVLSDGEAVAIGDFVESNGDGCLQKMVAEAWLSADAQEANTIYPLQIVGVALEALDLTGSSGAESNIGGEESSVGPLGYNKRFKVRIV